MRIILISIAVTALFAGSSSVSAQNSCGGFQSMCAARCQQRAPQDKNCVSDHCTPKLQECRSTGCWQEGRLYGGKLTCNLRKG